MLDGDRLKALRDYENAKEGNVKKARKMVIDPEYVEDARLGAGCYREVNVPPNKLFEPLGWDR